MEIAALIAWVLTALGGFVILGRWIANGGLRQQRDGATRFPAGLVFSHFGVAAVGLVLWIVYLLTDTAALAWVSFALLVVAALLGFTLFGRWLPVYRGTAVAAGGAPGTTAGSDAAERHLPVAVVAGHGVLAAATIVLVLVAALQV